MQNRVAQASKIAGLAIALALLLACSLYAPKPAYADSADDSEIVGNLSVIVAVFDPAKDNFYDGHTYLLFTSYKDGLTLNFTNLYGYYKMDEDFFNAAQKDEQLWLYDSGMTSTQREALANSVYTRDSATAGADPRFRKTSYSCVLNPNQFVTIGDYTMVADEEKLNDKEEIVRLIQDAIMHSSIVEPWISSGTDIFVDDPADPKTTEQKKEEFLKGLKQELETLASNPNITLVQVQSVISTYFGTHLKPEYAAQVNAALSSRNLYDGATTGGVFVNREMWRQKLWQNMSPVTRYNVDITQKQLDDLMAFVNDSSAGNNQNYYSVLAHNCATFSSGAWNAAVGYNRDANGNNIPDSTSPLYIDAADTGYSFAVDKFDSPRKMQQVVKPWGTYQAKDAIIHGVKAPEKPDPDPDPKPSPDPDPTPADPDSESDNQESADIDTSAHGTPKTGDDMTSAVAGAAALAALLGIVISVSSLRRREA